MKYNFHISIWLTFSKLMALIILILGVTFAFVTSNSEVFIFSISLAAGLSGLKSWSSGLTQRRKIDRWDYNDYSNDYYDDQNNKKPQSEIG